VIIFGKEQIVLFHIVMLGVAEVTGLVAVS